MKRLVIGLVLLVILSVVGYVMYVNQGSSTLRKELSDFAFADTAGIERIVMTDQEGRRVELRRAAQGKWTVNNSHTARPDAVQMLLTTIKKLSVKTPVSQAAVQTTLKTIIANHSLVEIYTSGSDPVKTYYVGGPDRDHTGTMMMMKGSNRPFIVHIEGFHGFLTPRYFTNELEWRSREVFELDPAQILSISMKYPPKPQENWRIGRMADGGISVMRGAAFERPAAIDTLALNTYLANYKMVHYESYEVAKEQPFIDSVLASTPLFSLVLVTTDGTERTVNGYKKPLKGGYDMEGNPIDVDQDRLYIHVDASGFYVAQYAIFDKLTKGVYFFK